MSKNAIRKDKTCLNCRYVVEQRFCPNCGQENIESRKTFHHLFVHFFEDLTHYENAFWRTIKNLLFKPASLTKEYLSGKRLSYLAPVRLYIFISFITFFLLTTIPNPAENFVKISRSTTSSNGHITVGPAPNFEKVLSDKADSKELKDSIIAAIKESKGKNKTASENSLFGYKSIKEVDSIQKFGKASDKLNDTSYWVLKKGLEVYQHNTKAELIEKFKESFLHNFSKTLFIYMPLFAFFLWIFHGKRRWYYFDHGIFTLHYFSFLLLNVLIIFLFSKFLSLFGTSVITEIIRGSFNFVAFIWMFYYFFPAHHRFYGESRLISFIKSILLFVINLVLIVIIIALFAIYTFINIH